MATRKQPTPSRKRRRCRKYWLNKNDLIKRTFWPENKSDLRSTVQRGTSIFPSIFCLFLLTTASLLLDRHQSSQQHIRSHLSKMLEVHCRSLIRRSVNIHRVNRIFISCKKVFRVELEASRIPTLFPIKNCSSYSALSSLYSATSPGFSYCALWPDFYR